jgi:hypothetical protein
MGYPQLYLQRISIKHTAVQSDHMDSFGGFSGCTPKSSLDYSHYSLETY